MYKYMFIINHINMYRHVFIYMIELYDVHLTLCIDT